jgi:hypothetical protein
MTIQCETCGRPTEQQFLCPDGDSWHILCGDCASQLNTCSFCKKVNVCTFETDPSPLPKMVQKQIRQGPMITVTAEMNPERIRQTCEKGCDCFDANFGCMRQFHYCERIDHVYDDSKAINTGEPETPADSTELHSEVHE